MVLKVHSGLAVGAMVALVLAGCGSSRNDDSASNPQYSSISEPMSFESARQDEIDLIRLIDPENRRALLPGDSCPVPEEELTSRKKEVRQAATLQEMECAFQAFRTYSVSYRTYVDSLASGGDNIYERASGSLALAVRRNEIQDRMILRSDALCRDFERRLDIQLKIENDTNFGNWMRNSQDRLLGGVGSLILGGDVLWALTNASKITDLPGYVHDQGQIEKNTLRIALEGMKLNRKGIFASVDSRRRAPVRHGGLPVGNKSSGEGVTPITKYSLERAISDALSYHNSCSVNSGLNYAAKVLTNSTPEVGLIEFPAIMSSSVNP